MRKPCCDKEGTNKGAWSKQEDQKLVEYIKAHGEGCWRSLPKAAGLQRCGKSCRLRWINYLRPDIKRGNFGQDEEDLIIKLHALLGNRWSLIAGRLPGRTDNEVKNYWNSHIRKKLIKLGIDPNNHRLNQYQNIIFQSQSQAPINDDHDDHDHDDDDDDDHHQAMKPSTTTVSSSNNAKGSVDQARVERATSGSTSCLDDESTSRNDDSSNAHLNLNLTIAFPSGREAEIVKTTQSSRDQKKTTTIREENMETVICNAANVASSPTLVLFR